MAGGCYKCKERKIGCHSTCTKYKEFRKTVDETNKKRREEYFNDLDKSNRMSNFRKCNSANLVKKGFTKTKV